MQKQLPHIAGLVLAMRLSGAHPQPAWSASPACPVRCRGTCR